MENIKEQDADYPLYLFLHYARISKPIILDLKEPTLKNPRNDMMRGIVIILEYLGLFTLREREEKRLKILCREIKQKYKLIEYQIIWGKEVR